jgi:hypothetical protein
MRQERGTASAESRVKLKSGEAIDNDGGTE